MEIYMVGGAVRDALLGLPVQDRDWVLVGADPQQLVAQGYLPVGKDFPVFLHPQSREEYALARTERKTAPGYHGFAVHAAPDVTLAQDLARRDLTINAMAVAQRHLDAEGRFAPEAVEDPFGGRRDLQQRVLRHVTDAFREDPVRILRLARFAARFADFSAAPETLALMRAMVDAGEAAALVAERVWQELARGLMEAKPSRMLQVLADCTAFAAILPEWSAATASATSPRTWHARLDAAAAQGATLAQRFALLCLPLQDAALLRQACERLRVPTDCRDLALLLQLHGPALRSSLQAPAAQLVEHMDGCDAWRRPERFAELLQASALAAVAEDEAAAQEGVASAQRLAHAHAAASGVDTASIAAAAQRAGQHGPGIARAIHTARVSAVAHTLA